MYLQGTGLCGALKHACPIELSISNTEICSNLSTPDIDFSYICYGYLSNANLQGNLSGVTCIYNCFYNFSVYGNENLYGSNEFIDFLFINRRNWCRNYFYIDIREIGDKPLPTGGTEQSGNTGTWSGSIWDLTEDNVNNLAEGREYNDNIGPPIYAPWNSYEKVWWWCNAKNKFINSK